MSTNTPDPWWDFTARNDRIVALAALSPGRGRIDEDDDLRRLKTTGVQNEMSILTETTKAQDTTSKWHGKVTAGAVVAAWWPTTATVAVVEIAVGDVLRLLVHVNRSQKTGKHYAAPPASKRGDQWLPHFEFADPALGKEVERVAVGAVEAALLAKVGAGTQHEDDPDEMPF